MNHSFLPGLGPERKIQQTEAGLLLTVRVTPNAKRAEIVGWKEGMLRVKLVSPPEKGRANRELCELMAGLCQVAKSRVELLSGETSRIKVLLLKQFTLEMLPAQLQS